MTVPQMHSGLLHLITENVDAAPLVLAARIGMGGTDLATAVGRQLGALVIDTVVAGGETSAFAAAVGRAVVHREFSAPLNLLLAPGADNAAALESLAEIYGSQMGAAIAIAAGQSRPEELDWNVGAALGSRYPGDTLIILGADRLSSAVLWELRDLASDGLRLLLVSTPEHRDKLSGANAAFYGFGSYLEMPVLALSVWTRKLGADVDQLGLRQLFEQVRGRTGAMLEVLHRRRAEDRDLSAAWFRTVYEREQEAWMAMSLASHVHELAPGLLLALAHSEPPYGGGHLRPDRVALALRHLRDVDLVEQPSPRRWQLADPLLAAALKHLRPDYVDVFPEL